MEIRKSQEVIDLCTFLTPISHVSVKSTCVVFKCECFKVSTNAIYEYVFTIIISI